MTVVIVWISVGRQTRGPDPHEQPPSLLDVDWWSTGAGSAPLSSIIYVSVPPNTLFPRNGLSREISTGSSYLRAVPRVDMYVLLAALQMLRVFMVADDDIAQRADFCRNLRASSPSSSLSPVDDGE